MQFNWAERTNVPNYDSSGIDPGTNFYEAVIKKHKIRTKIATKKILDKNLEKRCAKKQKARSDNKVTYMAACFCMLKEPDNIYVSSKQKN